MSDELCFVAFDTKGYPFGFLNGGTMREAAREFPDAAQIERVVDKARRTELLRQHCPEAFA